MAFFLLWVANRWLSMRIDLLGAFVVFFAGTAVVMSSGVGGIDAGLAGLSLSYALTFTDALLVSSTLPLTILFFSFFTISFLSSFVHVLNS